LGEAVGLRGEAWLAAGGSLLGVGPGDFVLGLFADQEAFGVTGQKLGKGRSRAEAKLTLMLESERAAPKKFVAADTGLGEQIVHKKISYQKVKYSPLTSLFQN
jgi:hypothetical protein